MPARSTGLWAVVGVLLVLAAVPPLLVPAFARETPRLWGFPFFFWFQFLLVIWAVAMTSTAYYFAKAAFRRDRAARASSSPTGPSGPTGPTGEVRK